MKLTAAQRATLGAMFGGLCSYCGQPLGKGWHADHREPIRRDDWGKVPHPPMHPERDNLANLMPACAPCNIDKHAHDLEYWRGLLQRRCGVLAYSHGTYRSMLRFGQIVETGAPIVFHFEKVALNSAAHGSQHVLKAEPATADATDRDAHVMTTPAGGPMGTGQTAAAAPFDGLGVAA